MPPLILFDDAVKNIANGLIDLDSHVFKAVLTNTEPDTTTHDLLNDITQIASTGGYAAVTLTTSLAETDTDSGIWAFLSSDPAWTASGADIAAHQYLVIYDDTASGDPLLGYCDRGSSEAIVNGTTRTWEVGDQGLLLMDGTLNQPEE